MNKGIEILLERMKSNPEEFTSIEGYSNKWAILVREYENILSPEDVKAFHDARNALLQDQFTSEVMKELLDPKSKEGVTLTSIRHPIGTSLGGATLGAYSNTAVGSTLTSNSLTLGKTTIDETTLQHMKAHTEYLRIQMEAEKTKAKQKTLVGKLYNYLGTNK